MALRLSLRCLGAIPVLALLAVGCGGEGNGAMPPAANPGQPAAGAGSPEFGDQTVRVPGASATDVAGAAILAAYPPEEGEAPGGFVLFPDGDWHAAANAAQFAAQPVDAALLPIEPEFLPPAAADLISRIEPRGFPRGEGIETVVVGEAGDEVIAALESAKLNLTRIAGVSPVDVSRELVPYRGGWAQSYSDTILAVSATEPDYALAAMSWSAFSGDTIAFVGPAGVPVETQALLAQREELRLRQPTIYAIGPESVIPDAVLGELAGFGEVRRVAGEDPVETAVELARLRDEDTAFGWGLDRGPASLLFASLREPDEALGALNLSGAGPRAPLLLLDGEGELPPSVRGYLAELRNREGNQGFVIGDRRSISSRTLLEIDRLLAPAAPPASEKRTRSRD